jgi:hypothetical protein
MASGTVAAGPEAGDDSGGEGEDVSLSEALRIAVEADESSAFGEALRQVEATVPEAERAEVCAPAFAEALRIPREAYIDKFLERGLFHVDGLIPGEDQTPLLLAAAADTAAAAVSVVRKLLAAGADANRLTKKGGATPLMRACAVGYSSVAEELLRGGAQVRAHAPRLPRAAGPAAPRRGRAPRAARGGRARRLGPGACGHARVSLRVAARRR